MKPSVQDATHYHSTKDLWYRLGEETVYFWDTQNNKWRYSLNSPHYIRAHAITAQEALERGYKYPPYHGTTEGVIVDSTPSGEVLEASKDASSGEKELDEFYKGLASNIGTYYDLGPMYTSTSDALKEKWEQRMSSDVCKKWIDDLNNWSTPSMFINEPLIPDMTEANDRKQRVETSVTSANNRQVGGDHYKKMKIQPWDLFGSIFNLDEQIGFYLGNVYKYLMRYDSKNGIEDLMKAKHYLEKLIEVKRGAASADVTDKH